MRRILLLPLLLALLGGCNSGTTSPDPGGPPGPPADPLETILTSVRSSYGLPGLAAAVVAQGELTAAAVGVRKTDDPTAVQPDDRWHVGSITKSMTATLAALMVEDGVLSWTTTIAEALPELDDAMRAEYREVTLQQLLSHRSGLPAFTDPEEVGVELIETLRSLDGPAPEQRRFLARQALGQEPVVAPGTGFVYSNAGYVVAGLMLETRAGEPWEQLLRRRLLDPLGLESAGHGAPASVGAVDQPWGHVPVDGAITPVPPGPSADNPVALGPAGRVHMSIQDLAGWAAAHLRAARGESGLIGEAAARRLHTPVGEEGYALGLYSLPRTWAGGNALFHAGSNGTFFAVMWIAPERDFAVVAATNVGGDAAFRALDEVASRAVIEWLGG